MSKNKFFLAQRKNRDFLKFPLTKDILFSRNSNVITLQYSKSLERIQFQCQGLIVVFTQEPQFVYTDFSVFCSVIF